MHLFSRRNASLALSLAAVGVLAACGDDVIVPLVPPTPVTISITPQAVTLNPGQTGTLSVQISGGDPTPTLATCASATPAVATAVVAGSVCTVTAVASGNTTVTATTSAGQSASAAVSVNQLPAALGELTVSPSTNNLVGGQTVQLVPNPNSASTGVTVAYQYTSSSPAIASVNASGLVTAGTVGNAVITIQATGTGTGFSSATRTTTATVNVLSAPAGVTSLTASPSSLALATSGTGSVAASVQQPSGAPAAVLTFGTTNPAVATVAVDANDSNLATVTAVSQGTATITVTATSPAGQGFSASTLTQLISVTVAPAAQVSIGNITSGQTNNPVDITNVTGQIQVPVNITTNGQNVQSVQLWVCEVGEAVADCAARSGEPAAQQTFGAAGANSGIVSLFINTAAFTTDADFTDAVVRHTNGQKTIVATLTVAGQATVANNNLAILNFNNTDGFAAKHTPPARSAVNETTNTTFFGGPGEEGRGEVTVVPVIYTEGRTIQRVTAGVTGVCGGSLTFITGTDDRPWTYTYGYSVSTSTSASTRLAADNAANNIACSAQSAGLADPDIAPRVISSIDNSQNAGPSVAMVSNFRISTSNSPAVLTPASIRVDYIGPAVATPDIRNELPAVTGWVNGSFDFEDNTGSSSDAGVGLADGRQWQVTGCGTDSFTAIDGTSGPIAECVADATGGYNAAATAINGAQTRGPYRVRIVEQDLLENSSNGSLSARFGVDKTAPFIRWSALSVEDTTVLDATTGAVMFQAEFIDERGGFIDGADIGNVTADGVLIDDEDGSQFHFASRALGDIIAISGTTKAVCINPNSFAAIANTTSQSAVNVAAATGAAFQTNPACSFRVVGFDGNLGFAPENDGYRAGIGATLAAEEGIYHYATRVYDRAGNSSDILRRRLAVDETQGLIANLSVPATVSATANPVLTYNAQDNVEIRATNIQTNFNSALTGNLPLAYPQVLVDARFNDNINSPIGQAQTSLNTPTPVLIGLTGDVNAATPVFNRLNTVQLTGFDVANIATNSLSGGFLSQGLPALGGALAGAGNYTSWGVITTRDAGFNAPEGLKAQLIANTNVTNSPFSRVEFYRLTAGTWQYLGSTATAIPADQGATRYWTYVLADANYAGLPNEFETTQDPAANGDDIVAVGIRNGGAGFITAGQTIGGPAAVTQSIPFNVVGLPLATSAGSVTITDGLGYSATVAVVNGQSINVPEARTYFITGNDVTIGTVTYTIDNVSPANVNVPVGGSSATVTVTYNAPPQVQVSISGLPTSVVLPHSLTGALGFNTTLNLGNTPTLTFPVVADNYTFTPAPLYTTGTLRYTPSVNGVGLSDVEAAALGSPAVFTTVYSQQNQRLAVTTAGPAGLVSNVSVNCGVATPIAGALGTTFPVLGALDGAVAGPCAVTAADVLFAGQFYTATISNVTPTASTAGFTTFAGAPASAQVTVTYAVLTPGLVITDAGVAPGNLPNGLTYTVRVTSSEYAATGGFQDFTKTTGTNLPIPVVPGAIYNFSTSRVLTSQSQIWNTMAASVAEVGGAGLNTITETATNVVVEDIISATTPANSGEVRTTITISWNGPNPAP